ncbi:hypothetical protein [Undibacterium sp. Ren11W]|uniref:hypothetical protein n=1 Tax=Undibacterium sp. Ren11W TaxID=3413045 RepID=UPI003BF0EC0B
MNAIKNIEVLLSHGETPSYSEIEAALEQALRERNFHKRAAEDLINWMSSLVTAQLCSDTVAVTDILACFIEKNVRVGRQHSNEVH